MEAEFSSIQKNTMKTTAPTQTARLTAAVFTLLLALFGGTGCSTTNSTKASALKPVGGAKADLSAYQIATVIPFALPTERTDDPGVGARFATDIASRLKTDFGPLFKEVQLKEQAAGVPNELIVTGTIRTYKPGSRFGRAMLIGVTPAVLKADLILKDAATGRELLTAPIDKLWAWGGLAGASKGIEEMVAESAAAAARTIAESKGWTPSAGGK